MLSAASSIEKVWSAPLFSSVSRCGTKSSSAQFLPRSPVVKSDRFCFTLYVHFASGAGRRQPSSVEFTCTGLPAASAAVAVSRVTAGTTAKTIAADATSESTRRGSRLSAWTLTIGHPCRIDSVPRSVSPVAPRDRAQNTGRGPAQAVADQSPPGRRRDPPVAAPTLGVRPPLGQFAARQYVRLTTG